MLAQRNTEHGSGLGIYRWVIERSLSHSRGCIKANDCEGAMIAQAKDRRSQIHQALLTLASALICFSFL